MRVSKCARLEGVCEWWEKRSHVTVGHGFFTTIIVAMPVLIGISIVPVVMMAGGDGVCC